MNKFEIDVQLNFFLLDRAELLRSFLFRPLVADFPNFFCFGFIYRVPPIWITAHTYAAEGTCDAQVTKVYSHPSRRAISFLIGALINMDYYAGFQ